MILKNDKKDIVKIKSGIAADAVYSSIAATVQWCIRIVGTFL